MNQTQGTKHGKINLKVVHRSLHIEGLARYVAKPDATQRKFTWRNDQLRNITECIDQ